MYIILVHVNNPLQYCDLCINILIYFSLCQPEMLKELINLVVLEPSAALDESERFKLPNIASEILTCENQALTLHIASEESLLQHLYTFVDQPPPLNPLLSSFFSKAFAALLVRKSDQVRSKFQIYTERFNRMSIS